MLKLYAITVYYLLYECNQLAGQQFTDLEADDWAVPLFDAMTLKFQKRNDKKDWHNTDRASVLSSFRRLYRNAVASLKADNPHHIISVLNTTVSSLLNFACIKNIEDLNKEFHPEHSAVTYTLLKDGERVVRVLFFLDSSNLKSDARSVQYRDNSKTSNTEKFRPASLPAAPSFFVGREKLLKQIHEALLRDRPSNILLLQGIGGMGKSTVMQQYVNSQECGAVFDQIIFVPVNHDLPAAFVQATSEALVLKDEIKGLPSREDELTLLAGKMSTQKGFNLVVIDNINESDYEDLKQYKHFFENSRWRYLITSRAAPDGFEKLRVDELNKKDAATLFAYHYFSSDQYLNETSVSESAILAYINRPEVRKPIDRLLEHIVRHTLLTELLAKAARKKGLSFADLLEKLIEDDFRHNDLQRVIDGGAHQRHLSETTVHRYILELFDTDYLIMPTGDAAKDEEHRRQADMLRFFSVLPSMDIPLEHLQLLWGVPASNNNGFQNRLDLLRQIGWLNGKHEIVLIAAILHKISYKMHPLVQQVVHERLTPDIQNCRPLMVSLQTLFNPALPDPQTFQHYAISIRRKLIGLPSKPE